MAAPIGLFEAHLAVADLDAAIAFYRDVPGLQLAHITGDRRAAFFWIGARGRAMVGLWSGGSAPQKITTHIAFAAALDDVLAAPRALRSAGIDPLDFDARPTDEAVVIGWMPAASVYFRDPDGHLLEYIAMLADAPQPECGVVSWNAWQLLRRARMSGSGSGSRGAAGVYGIMSEYRIAHARPEDLAQLPLIELAASQLLSGHAPASVLNETTSQDALLKALRDGHLWVVLADGAPVGFARVEMLDVATAHVEEIDVLPSHGRRGLGTRLVTHVCRWAAAGGYTSVTLTTFRDVPWNMPFYERLGFRVVPAEELSPALRARVDDETRRGLDPSRRVVMKRPCDPVE